MRFVIACRLEGQRGCMGARVLMLQKRCGFPPASDLLKSMFAKYVVNDSSQDRFGATGRRDPWTTTRLDRTRCLMGALRSQTHGVFGPINGFAVISTRSSGPSGLRVVSDGSKPAFLA